MGALTRRVLIISNGYGEDSIGATIVRALPDGLEVSAYPTLGPGTAYAGTCPIVGPRAALPSEGSRYTRGSVWRDFAGGGVFTVFPGLGFLRSARGSYDRVAVVGDFVGVAGCFLAGLRDIVWVDVYNTGIARTYGAIERYVAARTCCKVFTRAENLAEQLRRDDVDATFAGNVLLDTIPAGEYAAARRRRQPHAILLLPGSRGTLTGALALQLQTLAALRVPVDVFLALSPGADAARIAEAVGLSYAPPETAEQGDAGMLQGDGVRVHLGCGVLGNLLDACDLVLSQAGTATVQALGSGRPVLTFRGPVDRARRLRNEAALFGPARQLLPADPAAAALAITDLLDHPARLDDLARDARRRLGPAGALPAVVSALAS